MTYRKVLAGTALAAALAIGFGGAAMAADSVTLRFNQWFPSAHWSQKDGLFPWFEEIAKVTEGRVVVQSSNSPLAPPTRNYQAVVDGIADMAWGPHGYTPGLFPLTELVELPFKTEDAGVSSVAYWRLWEAMLKPTGMQGDVVTLGMHVTAGGNIHMREAPVLSVEDLKAKRLRVPTPVVGRVLAKLGAVPVSGSLNELREMLSRGAVDGTAITDELVVGFKVDKEVHAITQIPGGIYSNSAFIIVNAKIWGEIAPKDQQAILAISGEAISRKMGALWQQNDTEARSMFQQRLGDKYVAAPEALMAGLRTAFAEDEAAIFAKAKELGVDPEAALAFYNQQIQALGGK